jgi:hypothetical protein
MRPAYRETLRGGLLAAAEVGLCLFYPPVRRHFVLAPSTEWTVRAAPDMIPGVFGINHFRANEFGIRGAAFGDERTEYRILAVGGSATECVILDDTKAWPYLLGVDVGRTADGRRVWVGNVGRSGATSRDNVLHLKYLGEDRTRKVSPSPPGCGAD